MKKKKKDTALKWIYRCSKRYLWAVMLMAMITGVISGSFILLALISSRLLDIASGSMEGSLGVEISIIACLIFLQAVLNIVYRNLQIRTATKIEMSIRQGIFSMLQRKQYRDVCGMHSGEILNRLTSDIDLVVVGVVGLIPQAISLSTKILAGLGVLLSIDATFTFLVLGVGVMVFVCSRLYSRRFKHLHKEVQRTNGIVRSFLQECLENLAVIKSFANGDLVCDKLGQYQRENYRIRVKRTAISNFANTAVYVMFTAGYYAALAWGALQISVGALTFGKLTAFLQIIQQIKAPFRNASGLVPQYYSMLASAERLMELEQWEDEKEAARISDVEAFYEDFQAIVAECVTFSYEQETILENASLRIEKGELVALVGESGIGKSTLMKLLLHLIPCDQGRLYLETGKGQVELDAGIRSLFAYVPQGNMMMSGTIRENISFCNPRACEEQIIRAARIACIWDDIASLPSGLDTVLAERGAGLSEGQIQRIAIARAVLSDAPILLLDECTASLDRNTEWKVLQNIKSMNTKTILCISHTPAAVECCDRVVRIVHKQFMEERKNVCE